VEIEDLPLQQDIANMAGTSRETVSRHAEYGSWKRDRFNLTEARLRSMIMMRFARNTFDVSEAVFFCVMYS